MVTTVLTSVEQKNGRNAKGPWTLNIFTAQDGIKYQTFDNTLAAQAHALMGSPVQITFELKPNGEHMNNVITEIALVQAGAVVQPVVQAGKPIATPTPAGVTPVEKDARITRAAALDRALTAFGIAGEDPIANPSALYELSEEYAAYLRDGLQTETTTAAPVVATGPTV